MSFLNNLKKVLHLGGGEAKKKRIYNNIRMDCDPTEYWEMIGELGDGAFGTTVTLLLSVWTVCHRSIDINHFYIFRSIPTCR